MTATQMTAMIGIGTVLVKPITNTDLGITFFVVFFVIILMIISEYLEMKFDFLETFFSGKAIMVVEQGKLNIDALKRLRMSVDSLEIKLREAGISSIGDVEYAMVEANGELGYKLKDGKKPLTKDDFIELMSQMNESKIPKVRGKTKISKEQNDIFKEVKTKKHEGNKNERLD
jgi:uncharacterized membrane protein YcaP (DUF421 family)